jgi:hypothetical protein
LTLQYALTCSQSEWESRVPATLQSKRGEQLFDNVVFQDFDLDAHDVEEELGGLRDFVQQQEREAGVATAESQVGKLRQSTRGELVNVARPSINAQQATPMRWTRPLELSTMQQLPVPKTNIAGGQIAKVGSSLRSHRQTQKSRLLAHGQKLSNDGRSLAS